MPAIDLHAPVLGPPGQRCAACGEPLAADQRYCLSCGERRGPARLDPLAHARGRSGDAAPPSAPPAAVAGGRRATAWPLPSRRVAGVATLLMLGFGVAAGAAAGPRADPTLASATRRPTIVVAPPPAAAPVARPAPAPAAKQPRVSPPAGTSAPSTADSSTADTSAPASSAPDSSAPDSSSSGSSSPDSPASGDSGSGSGSAPASGDSSTTPEPASFKHVWIVALTGHTMDEALANPSPMPYLDGTLRPKGLLLSGYKPALPGGLANLIALVSGQRPTAEQRGGCPAYDDVDPKARTGCVFAKDVDTLQGQLTAVGKTWRAYVEDSDAGQPPDTCRHPAPGGALEPVMARNPLLFFHAIVDSPDCAANTAGTSRLIPDTVDAESAPTLSLVIPDACHDGADQPCAAGAPAGPAAADAWLNEQLEPLLASKAYKDGGLVLVTFDTAPDATKPVGALLIGDGVTAGGTDDGDYRPANLLRTLEDGLTLDPLARAKDVHAVSITKPSR
jgi:phosphatidylinositol-3-phosphatase